MSLKSDDDGLQGFGVAGRSSTKRVGEGPPPDGKTFGVFGIVGSDNDTGNFQTVLNLEGQINTPLNPASPTVPGLGVVPPCGVYGASVLGANSAGVVGEADFVGGTGVFGLGNLGVGVHGVNDNPNGSADKPDRGCGVLGESVNGFGVYGVSDNHFAISAFSRNGVGLSAEGGRLAAFFRGTVQVDKGDIFLTDGQDCAEDFDVSEGERVQPGSVMVIDEEGVLHQCCRAYDKRVAGVISGAGNFKPGITLDKQHFRKNRLPVALLGKVYCKVDAKYAAVQVGDLLTTSDTQGHAMKATDASRAFGAVIGKALRALAEGTGMIPILIALQ